MIITIKYATDDNGDTHERLSVDGEERLAVGPLWECPEDAIIGRSLVSCGTIAKLMLEASTQQLVKIETWECSMEELDG